MVGPGEEPFSDPGRLLHLPRALRHLAPRRGQIYLSVAAGVLRGAVVRRDVRRGRHVRPRPGSDRRAEGPLQARPGGGRVGRRSSAWRVSFDFHTGACAEARRASDGVPDGGSGRLSEAGHPTHWLISTRSRAAAGRGRFACAGRSRLRRGHDLGHDRDRPRRTGSS